jgi:hypothetical protein
MTQSHFFVAMCDSVVVVAWAGQSRRQPSLGYFRDCTRRPALLYPNVALLVAQTPSSLRHLQIDTQAVAFPPIKEEIEPFFCSIAIYKVGDRGQTSSKKPAAQKVRQDIFQTGGFYSEIEAAAKDDIYNVR